MNVVPKNETENFQYVIQLLPQKLPGMNYK